MSFLSLPGFIARWQKSTISEIGAYQTHFNELCALLGQCTPPEADPSGKSYAFQKGARKTDGGDGFADVWKRGYFAWEYKTKGRSLDVAYRQLLQYREDLENPPLLVVCDFNRFEVHTNFTNSAKQVYRFGLCDLAEPAPLLGARFSAWDTLRFVFTDPEKLRPEYTPSQVTEQAAAEFAALARSLDRYRVEPERAAHLLVRLLFCLFAQDVGLLPNHLFTQLVDATRTRSVEFSRRLGDLFGVMASGGAFGLHDVPYFGYPPKGVESSHPEARLVVALRSRIPALLGGRWLPEAASEGARKGPILGENPAARRAVRHRLSGRGRPPARSE